MPLKWGICGSGKISQDFVNALKLLPVSDHEVKAVAASDVDKAEAFAKQYDIPLFFGSYEQLMKCNQIDVVYIGLMNSFHKEQTLSALKHNKHVLCEKVMATCAADVEEMVEAARQKNLFLMEGYWSRCFPSYEFIKSKINGGSIGDLTLATACFGANLDPSYVTTQLNGGALLTVGCYCVQLSSFLFGSKPSKVVATGYLNQYDSDSTANVTLLYPNQKMFSFVQSDSLQMENNATLTGTKGEIKIPFHWCPNQVVVNDKVVEFYLPQKLHNSKFNFLNSEGLAYEAEEVRKCLAAGKTESEKMPLNESIDLAKINDQILHQLNA